MGKRIDRMLYPDGKSRALTFSYDDGVVQDRRLVAILNQYGMKGTFNLNYGYLGFQGTQEMNGRMVDISKIAKEEVPVLYQGHEVAGHGMWHSSLPTIESGAAMWEIIEDKYQLEKISPNILKSFAYPFGETNSSVCGILRLAGYEGARTVKSTYCFELPENFLMWHPTCHHGDPRLMELAKAFCEEPVHPLSPAKLFYVWGHAYEFDADDNWNVIERLTEYLSAFSDQIWFATNGEIMDYVHAYQGLQYSADACRIHNPYATDVWMSISGKVYQIPAGETVRIQDPGI